MTGFEARLTRSQAIDRLQSGRFDLLIVGGGITGAGIALDAASRGMSVALIDKGDFASGTSSKSSKLVHGGLRYLAQRDFGLVREAAHERELLSKLAPHLVTPMPFLMASWAGGSRKAGIGLAIYDFMAGLKAGGRHRKVDADDVSKLVPSARKSGDGYVFYDCVTDDSRLTLALLHESQKRGSVVCNYVEAREVDGSERGFVCVAADTYSSSELEIEARAVVNATGIWADDLRTERGTKSLRPSKGIHLVLPAHKLPVGAACLIPAGRGRVLFVLPWRSSIIVGTTDTPYDGSLDSPAVGVDEVEGILESLRRAFDQEFSLSDVASAYAGLRPLLSDTRRTETRDLSRRHAIFTDPNGMVTITGGKLTTYRRMAKDAADLVAERLGFGSRSKTRRIPIAGNDAETSASVFNLADELTLPPTVPVSLLRSYGDNAAEVLALGREMDLLNPLTANLPYLQAEIVWAIRHEMATSVEDILARRTRTALEDSAGGLSNKTQLIALMAGEMHASLEEIGQQADWYLQRVATERGPVKVEGLSSRSSS